MAAVGVSAAGGGLLVAASNAPAAPDPTTVATDSLLRVNKPGQTIAPEVRQVVTRILVRSGKNGEVSQDDRTYLASVVCANTGLSQQDAEKRVSDAINTMKEALDRARRIGILLTFTGAILVLGAATAWWAAKVGGRRREEGTIWADLA